MWKTILITGVIATLAFASLALVAKYALEDKSVRATKERIEQYRIVAEEQRLIRQILEDKVAVAKIQASIVPRDPNE